MITPKLYATLQGQEGMPRNPKTARSGAIILELTAAKLRDCRVYLHSERRNCTDGPNSRLILAGPAVVRHPLEHA